MHQKKKRLASVIAKMTGMDNLSYHRKPHVISRIQARMAACGQHQLHQYLDEVESNKSEEKLFISAITINTTHWFREYSHFRILENTESSNDNEQHTVEILSAPCSTGEEPFSIAMAMEDLRLKRKCDYHVKGYDIDREAIETAKKGIYSEKGTEHIPKQFERFVYHGKQNARGMNNFSP